jgi:crotonobetainyl-CoA:carnitine CoA-transferase CaiB-like acyl-CoA transferase
VSASTADGGARLPLTGIRVLEVGNYAAAPYGGYLLSLLGAEVIKIEPPGTGDPMRGWGSSGSAEVSFFFRMCNAGKRSVAVNLKDADGVALVKSLLPGFDVMLTNLKKESLAKLGLSGEECLAVNSRLVHVAITGLGADGPLAGRPTFDSIAQALSGFLGLYLESGQVPSGLPAIGDLTGGLVVAAGVMAGLTSRGLTGQGMVVETSLLESLCAVLSSAHVHASHTAGADGLRRSAGAQMFQLKTADDRRIAIHLSTSQGFFANLAEAAAPHLLQDERFATYQRRVANFDALTQALQQVFVTRTSAEWEEALRGAGLPYGQIYSMAEAPSQPQIRELGLYDTDEQGRTDLFRGPWRFDGERPAADPHLPGVGEDNDAVLADVLRPQDMARLRERGVISEGPR